MSPEHQLNKDFQNHAITARTYANEAERNADLAWQQTVSINKVVFITDIAAYQVLVSVGPTVWQTIAGGNLGAVTAGAITAVSLAASGAVAAAGYSVNALETAPASASATGTLGEIRWTLTHIYLCTATDTWVRAAIVTW